MEERLDGVKGVRRPDIPPPGIVDAKDERLLRLISDCDAILDAGKVHDVVVEDVEFKEDEYDEDTVEVPYEVEIVEVLEGEWLLLGFDKLRGLRGVPEESNPKSAMEYADGVLNTVRKGSALVSNSPKMPPRGSGGGTLEESRIGTLGESKGGTWRGSWGGTWMLSGMSVGAKWFTFSFW